MDEETRSTAKWPRAVGYNSSPLKGRPADQNGLRCRSGGDPEKGAFSKGRGEETGKSLQTSVHAGRLHHYHGMNGIRPEQKTWRGGIPSTFRSLSGKTLSLNTNKKVKYIDRSFRDREA